MVESCGRNRGKRILDKIGLMQRMSNSYGSVMDQAARFGFDTARAAFGDAWAGLDVKSTGWMVVGKKRMS